MIIEGGAVGDVDFWSKHLQRTDTNEKVAIIDVRGTVAADLEGALREMQIIAQGSNCGGNFMYQVNINPLAHENLTPKQWAQAVDVLEKRLGLEDHQRVVVAHVKEGRQHYHAIWNRVDVENLRVKDIGGNYYTHERVARELEKEFKLEKTPRVHGEREGDRPHDRPLALWEKERGDRSGIDSKELKAELTELWRRSDNGPAFVAALKERGYVLAEGRRGLGVADHSGDFHNLARRLEGVRTKEVDARLGYIDRSKLPTADQAAVQQRAKFTKEGVFDRSAAAKAWADRPRLPDRVNAPINAPPQGRRERAGGLPSGTRPNPVRTPPRAPEPVVPTRPFFMINLDHIIAEGEARRSAERAVTREAEVKAAMQQDMLNAPQGINANIVTARAEIGLPPPRSNVAPSQLLRTGRQAFTEAKESVKDGGRQVGKGLQVADSLSGTVTKLGDFILDFLSGSPASKPVDLSYTTDENKLREQRLARTAAKKQNETAEKSLLSMHADMKAGRNLKSEDIKSLTRQHQEQIRHFGDNAVRQMVEEAQKRSQSYWKGEERERER